MKGKEERRRRECLKVEGSFWSITSGPMGGPCTNPLVSVLWPHFSAGDFCLIRDAFREREEIRTHHWEHRETLETLRDAASPPYSIPPIPTTITNTDRPIASLQSQSPSPRIPPEIPHLRNEKARANHSPPSCISVGCYRTTLPKDYFTKSPFCHRLAAIPFFIVL
ncbi:hypothetical protein BJ508DRAFT_177563 [Ascobolus immersus RN42]|uniref:Uncharacterized protein n=1 Tax=Ascobolus immersus RN42 TaxID=1160509 RepID=A0A3N4IH90_ASCIM|nr:hypothetical protein BJ508DRAFT_177563 [Ascobolus immersus RN42]